MPAVCFSCSVGKTAQNANKGRFSPFFRRRLAVTLQGIVCCCWVMTMYDMTRVNANGYFDSEDSEQARFEKRKALNMQRTEDYRSGTYALAGGVVDPLPEDAPQFVKDYYA